MRPTPEPETQEQEDPREESLMPKEPSEYQSRVDKGCALLNERLPGWEDKIDLEKLNLSSGCDCVLGQLSIDLAGKIAGSYGLAREVLFPGVAPLGPCIEHGFDVREGPGYYDALTECWRKTILSRREVKV